MKTQERLAFVTEIARRDENIGKTGMMKLLYLLQAVHKVPLGYDFEIYTYGPYCQSVMSDIEYAEFVDYIRVSPVTYPNGMSGYQIKAMSDGIDLVEKEGEVISPYNEKIDSVINFFGKKTAKELELYSTIVFVVSSFSDNDWEKTKEEICCTVKEIKPHFSIDTISAAYEDLESNGFLNSR